MALVTTPSADNADSYATLADANAYFASIGETKWTGSDAVKENALRRATNYLDNQYRGKWRGVRTLASQALAWPRAGVVDGDGFDLPLGEIPVQVQRATMEAALLVITGVKLEPVLDRGGAIKSVSKRVGALGKEIVYQDGAPVMTRIVAIEGLLRDIVTSSPGASSGSLSVTRA